MNGCKGSPSSPWRETVTETRFDLPTPDDEPARNYWGWIILTVMFVLTIGTALAPMLKRDARNSVSFAQEALQYEQAVSAIRLQTMADQYAAMLGTAKEKESVRKDRLERSRAQALEELDPVISRLAALRSENVEAAKLYVSMRTEQGKVVTPADLTKLRESKEAEDQALVRIYSAESLTREQATALTKDLDTKRFVAKMAKVHAFDKAGDPSVRRDLIRPDQAVVLISITAAACIAIFASMALWMLYAQAKTSGRLKIPGGPLGLPSMRLADELALRAAILFFAFLFMGAVVGAGLEEVGVNGAIADMVVGALVIVAAFAVIRIPIGGHRLTFAEMGLSTERLGQKAMWGLGGWIANIPLAATAMLIGLTIMRGAPAPSHPATDALLKDPDPVRIASIFFLGAVVAPIWEEIMFRGFLFPALGRPMGGVLGAALVSSFLFAMIHPQGAGAWLGLATVAGMGCALVHHTKSLIPAIVLHATHNFILLLATVSLGIL